MLGGYIIDKYGIIVNFTITVLVQIFVGTAPLILVSSYIPAENDASSMKGLWKDFNDIVDSFQSSLCQQKETIELPTESG